MDFYDKNTAQRLFRPAIGGGQAAAYEKLSAAAGIRRDFSKIRTAGAGIRRAENCENRNSMGFFFSQPSKTKIQRNFSSHNLREQKFSGIFLLTASGNKNSAEFRVSQPPGAKIQRNSAFHSFREQKFSGIPRLTASGNKNSAEFHSFLIETYILLNKHFKKLKPC
jgi:hypothetical protein